MPSAGKKGDKGRMRPEALPFKPSNFVIKPGCKMREELKMYQAVLEEELSDDMNEVEAKGAVFCSILARTGKMYADAKKEYNKALTNEIMEMIRELLGGQAFVSHTVTNQLVKAAAHEEQYLVDWAERLHKTCARQLDWCRSVLSKHKEEMRMNQLGGGGL